jgi:hypothetical protein
LKPQNRLDPKGPRGADRRMDDKTQKPPAPSAARVAREQALAQALRDNLKRRKAAAKPAKKDPA